MILVTSLLASIAGKLKAASAERSRVSESRLRRWTELAVVTVLAPTLLGTETLVAVGTPDNAGRLAVRAVAHAAALPLPLAATAPLAHAPVLRGLHC